MNFGRISFSRNGEDEEVLSVPWSPNVATLVRARLEEAGNDSFDGDNEAIGTYAAFYSAELAGKALVKLPKVDDIRPSDVFTAAVRYDFSLVAPDGTVEDNAGEAADENPTGTTRASS